MWNHWFLSKLFCMRALEQCEIFSRSRRNNEYYYGHTKLFFLVNIQQVWKCPIVKATHSTWTIVELKSYLLFKNQIEVIYVTQYQLCIPKMLLSSDKKCMGFVCEQNHVHASFYSYIPSGKILNTFRQCLLSALGD